MAETQTPEHPTPAAAPKKRRASAQHKRSTGKPSARRKKSPRRSRAGSTTKSLAALLKRWSANAAAAGKSLKALSGQGTDAARQAFQGVGEASKKTIARLTKQWERMDAKRRTQFVAALLAALAAASAPVVRKRMKR